MNNNLTTLTSDTLTVTLPEGIALVIASGDILSLAPGEGFVFDSLTIWRRPFVSARFRRQSTGGTIEIRLCTQDKQIRVELPRRSLLNTSFSGNSISQPDEG